MPNREEFERVCEELEQGRDLTLPMVERVFGADFSMMLIYTLMDSNDAARAIQGAIARLSTQRLGEETV